MPERSVSVAALIWAGPRPIHPATTPVSYQRPPRKRQAVPLEVPAVVKAAEPAKARKRIAAADQPLTMSGGSEPAAASDRKPAIVTIRSRKHVMLAHLLEDLTPRSFSGAAMPPMSCSARWCAGSSGGRDGAQAALAELRHRPATHARRSVGRAVRRLPVLVPAHRVRPLRQGGHARRAARRPVARAAACRHPAPDAPRRLRGASEEG